MTKIIPTIFARNKKEFNKRFKKLLKLNIDLHIDLMDGKFVKAKGILPKDIPNLKNYKIKFEAHLMTLNPEKYVAKLKNKGFKKIIFHYEAVNKNEILEIINMIKKNSMKAVIAINPPTQINNILPFINKIDSILFMGVFPGKEHQKFINNVYRNIRKLRRISKKIKIQVDGGVNLKIAGKLKEIGVNYLNSGSFISDSKEPKKALQELDKKFRKNV